MAVKEPNAKYFDATLMQQTDIGPMPIDWDVVPLAAVSEKIMVGIASAATHAYRDRGVVMFRNQNIKAGLLDTDDVLFLDPEYEKTYRNKRLRGGDLLTARTGYPGTTSVVPSTFEGAQSFTTLITRPCDSVIDPFYLCLFINGSTGRRYFEQAQIGGGQKNVNAASLKLLPIAVPKTLKEQRYIAETIYDSDTLINSLEQLLTKKRQIKQGAMQELLTGKRRLPGHKNPWAEEIFRNAAHAKRERVSPHLMAHAPRCIELEHIQSSTGRLNEQGFESTQAAIKTVFRKGDVLFGKLRAYLRKYWLAEFDGVCSTEIWALQPRGKLRSSAYLFYTVQRDDFIEAASSAYGTHMPRSDWNVVGSFAFSFPQDREEQRAIAQVLSDMDTDIAAVEARLAKARDLKQAMMQVLLTGRIRLIPPITSNVIPFPAQPRAAKPAAVKPAHNWQINEAVVIGALAQRFGTEKFPLPRKRRVKLMYLLHRHAEGQAEGYLKKAAGPYDPNTKYKGPEAIAVKKGYVKALHNGTYEGFVAGAEIDQALGYFEQWYGTAALDWLEQFRYRKTDELELLATVDMAMVDLAAAGQPADVRAVKRVIATHQEWAPKLARELFSDDKIMHAIAECQALFG